MRRWVVGVMVLTWLVGAVPPPAEALGPFQLYGNALAVREGKGRAEFAIELSSRCAAGAPACVNNGSLTYSGIAFKPDRPLRFSELRELSAEYRFKVGDCAGGSPRFQVNVDTDADGKSDGDLWIYIGPFPNFTSCVSGWQNTGNMLQATDARFDLSQFPGGKLFSTAAEAQALLGARSVVGVQFVVDGGWRLPGPTGQVILVDQLQVAGQTFTAGR